MHARAAALFLAAGALTAIAGVPLATPAGAAAPRTAEADPSTNLGDQVVHVTWQHFRPTKADGSYSVSILECVARPTSVLRDCNVDETYPTSLTGNQAQGTTQKDGTGKAFIDVGTTARLPALGCTASKPCSLLVYENTPDGFDANKLPAQRVVVPLQFRRSFGDCPPATHFDLKLESETSAAAAFYQWAADVCTGQGAFTLDVTNTSSNAARQQFFDKNVDIAVSSLPPQQSELPPDPRPYTVTPVDLTGIVIAYNIVDPVTHQQITDMKLTPRLVARLLSSSGVLTFFNDPEFKKLNPDHHWPVTASEAGVRAEKNGDTWIVTNWLDHNKQARDFLDGHDKYGVHVNSSWKNVKYPTDVFEARNATGAYVPHTGEEGVALKLFYATEPAQSVASVPSDVGFMGVLDLPTARRFDLPTAQLTDGIGQPSVSATDQSIQAAYRLMTPTAKGFYVVPPALSDPDAYPLTKVDHALAPTSSDAPVTQERINYLLAYAKTTGQKDLPEGFAPFPGPVVPSTTTTSTTSTTTIPTGSTVPGGGSGFSQTSGYNGTGTGTAPPPTGTLTGTGPNTSGGGAAIDTPSVATPKLALISANDGMALPIVFGLGLLALLYLLIDLARRRGPAFVASVRQRFAARRAGSATAAPPGASS
jgi:ABC-type phosphate transport system substrate-binding protein